MTDKPHLDEEALSELQDVMEDEFEILIETYLKDSRERIGSLREAMTSGDADAFAKAAHSFKGSCINIGAPHLGELCMKAEKAGKEGELSATPAMLDAIEAEFRNVVDKLGGFMGR